MLVVHIPCDTNTNQYVNYCFAAMERLATTGEQLVLRPHLINTDKQARYQPALNHVLAIAEALAEAAKQPDAWHVVCDSDTVVVCKGWDRVMKETLHRVSCLGTTYMRKGGRSTGSHVLQTFKDRPHGAWLALRPGEPWDRYVPHQEDIQNRLIETDEDVKIFGLSKGHYLLMDTCWDLPLFLHENKLTYATMENVDPLRSLKGLQPAHEEWWYDGKPFVVHQGKSRKNAFRQTEYSKSFYARCDELIKLAEQDTAPVVG